ncbi:hypothetical protein ES705_08860 [subsurface metagenome]
MKKYVLTLFALILLAGTSCQEKIDIEKEKEAIKAVIEEETNAAYASDFDRFAATYVQDETNIDLRAGKSGYSYDVGWEEIGSAFKEYFENNPEPVKNNEVKTNYKIKVYKDCAWAVFDNEGYNNEGEFTGKSIGVNFLEKVNGEWKIVYLSRVGITSYNVLSQNEPVKVDLISNGNKLNADFYPSSENEIRPTLILMHGSPGGEGDPLGLSKKLSSQGINVLVFNYQGTWSSEGLFSFENSMQDVGSAVDFLNQKSNIERFNIDTTNIVVCGYSFGGAMALTAALYNTEIKRIISIAGADQSVFGRKWLSDPEFRKMFESMLKKSVYPEGPIKYDLESYIKHWLDNLNYFDQVKHAEQLKNRDILWLGGWNDQLCIVEEHMLPLYRKLQELEAEKIKIKVFETNHSFSNVRDDLASTILNWIKKIN